MHFKQIANLVHNTLDQCENVRSKNGVSAKPKHQRSQMRGFILLIVFDRVEYPLGDELISGALIEMG